MPPAFSVLSFSILLRVRKAIRERSETLGQTFFPNPGKFLFLSFVSLDQWFSTGVPRNPWVQQKALWVRPIYELDVYLLVNCSWGFRKIVLKQRKVAANQKRLRPTALDIQLFAPAFSHPSKYHFKRTQRIHQSKANPRIFSFGTSLFNRLWHSDFRSNISCVIKMRK